LQVENEILKAPGGNCFETILTEVELFAGLLSVTEDATLKWPISTRPNAMDLCDSVSGAGVGLGVGVGIGVGVGLAVGAGVGLAVGPGVGVAIGVGAALAVGTGVGVATGV
jgi:hypothetical protein